MKNILLFLFCFPLVLTAQSPEIPFEQQENYSASYEETITFYEELQNRYPNKVQLIEYGMTDAGYPLHVVVLNKDGTFSPEKIQKQDKRVLLINNAIHPGEPCGVDATMQLFRHYCEDKEARADLNNVVVLAIPIYNIGGALNRSSYSRANQDGPKEYGFRGNSRNLDLNRDFIKNDSKNAKTFAKIWNDWQPDVFLDNHTSNGADYQYTMTMISTQKDKLAPEISQYVEDILLPDLFTEMKLQGDPMSPYVNVRTTPDEGIYGFLDLPRYSSGYAALHNAIGFTAEAHMLKPFKMRVNSTLRFMKILIQKINADSKLIQTARFKAIENIKQQVVFPVNWEIDLDKKEDFYFRGYTAKYKKSAVSGLDRLFYDHSEPYEKNVPFFNTYKAKLSIQAPLAYIIPQAYTEVVERLLENGVEVFRLKENTLLPVEMYYIDDYKTVKSPYEGHYLHYDTKVRPDNKLMQARIGDFVVLTNQAANRFVLETLEPQAPDSYFSWNFFDGVLMQKEYFSSYVFEDIAAEMLKNDPALKEALEEKRAEDKEFAASPRAQLDFIYKRSPYYEDTHNLYPIGRLSENVDISVEKVN